MVNGNKIVGRFTSNTEVTLFRRCDILGVFLANINGNPITGFKIGTTPNGGEIYTAPSPLIGYTKGLNLPETYS